MDLAHRLSLLTPDIDIKMSGRDWPIRWLTFIQMLNGEDF